MDDWQEAAFSSRHMHNPIGRSGKSRHASAFDVRKSFASYSVKCPSWQKALDAKGEPQSEQNPSMELYRLTDSGEGIIGQLFLPGVLQSTVILAGSRDSLQRTIADMESDEEATEDDDGQKEEEEDSGNTEPEPPAKSRFDTFEKNSFRSPKFWFRWSGVPVASPQTPLSLTEESDAHESNLGYIVFSSNDCRKFKGTINCATLAWKNVAISGHKLVARSESNAQVAWGRKNLSL